MTDAISDDNNDWNKLLENESERELQTALMNSVKSTIETNEDKIMQKVLRESLLSLDNTTHVNTPVSSDDEEDNSNIFPIVNEESNSTVNSTVNSTTNSTVNSTANNTTVNNVNSTVNNVNSDNIFMYPVHPLSNYPWFLQEEHQALENSNFGLFPESILKEISKNPNAMSSLTSFLISNPDAREHEQIDNNVVVPHSYIPHPEIYLPFQMFEQLRINPGEFCSITHITEKIAVGTHINLMPNEKEFLQIKDQESLMMNGIINKYTCIRQNNVIRVFSEEINQVLSFVVLKTEPAEIISLLDTDLEVEFKIPPAFLKPTKNAVETRNAFENKQEIVNEPMRSNSKLFNKTNDESERVENIEDAEKSEEVESPVETEEQLRKKREQARMARLAFFQNKTTDVSNTEN